MLKDSGGGNLAAALEVGRLIRKYNIKLAVFGKCYSSCALLYIAGIVRRNYDEIGLHRPYFGATLTENEIREAYPAMLQAVRDYVKDMGIKRCPLYLQ